MKRFFAWLIVVVLLLAFFMGPITVFFTWFFTVVGALVGGVLGIASVALIVFLLLKEDITSALPLAAVMTLALCVGFVVLAFQRNASLVSENYGIVLVLFLVGAGLSFGSIREQLDNSRL